MTLHYEFIYTSKLADSAHPSCVADIVKIARNFNSQHDITGVLIFDGAHFCQYLEGPQHAVLKLIAQIEKDARHTDFNIKYHGEFKSSRRFAGRPLAYALDDEGTMLEQLMNSAGAATSALLVKIMPDLDTEIP
jgi:hypothetical protein